MVFKLSFRVLGPFVCKWGCHPNIDSSSTIHRWTFSSTFEDDKTIGGDGDDMNIDDDGDDDDKTIVVNANGDSTNIDGDGEWWRWWYKYWWCMYYLKDYLW